MSEETPSSPSLRPHMIVAGVVLLVLVGGYFLLSDSPQPPAEPVDIPVAVEQPITPEPEPVVEEPEALPETQPEPVIDEPQYEEPLPAPEPLDVSDAAVKTALLDLTEFEAAGALLVNDSLLQRFVVLTTNMAEGVVAPNHQILQPPQQTFRVYQQGGKEWIDPASYKRYTPYINAIDEMDTESLVALYQTYKPAVRKIFAEIGDPDDNFDFVIIDAINHLLDTPEVPVPVEVYTDSVMYKFADERLEGLSGLQKHLLRTGPENMRRIKAKLREIKEAL